MEFITEEVKTELGLTDEQVSGLTPKFNDYIGTQKGEWDKKANENAEGIIAGAIKSTQDTFGVQLDRLAGEKNADYLKRLNAEVTKDGVSKVESLKADYERKLKEVGNGDATSKELESVRLKLDEAQKKYADYDDIKAKAEKYEPLEQQFGTMKEQVAFGGVKPTFPDTVNSYEAKAKWETFVSGVKDKYNVELVDGEAIAIDKENPHKTSKLSDLVKGDTELSTLIAGRQQNGTNARATGTKIDGLPFELTKEADSVETTKAVDEYLGTLGISKTSNEYATKFGELYKKAKEASKQ